MKNDDSPPPMSVRLDRDQIEAIERLVSEERSSRNAVVRRLLDEALRMRGARTAPSPLRLAPSADEPREPHTTTFPVVDLVAAGSGREIEFRDTGETVTVPNTLARLVDRKHWRFVRVVGDSMEPSFYDGDVVALEPASIERVKTRDVVYVRFNGEPQIKEIHLADKGRRVTLLPRNTRVHSPIPVLESDTLELVGIVRDLAHRADPGRKG